MGYLVVKQVISELRIHCLIINYKIKNKCYLAVKGQYTERR